MPKVSHSKLSPESAAALRTDIAVAIGRIPPLWDLNNYVAVNPFLGFSELKLDRAAKLVGDGLDAQVLPSAEYYRQKWEQGAFAAADLKAAASRAGTDPTPILKYLEGHTEVFPTRHARKVLTFAERVDRQTGSDWQEQAVRWIARWCAMEATATDTNFFRSGKDSVLFRDWFGTVAADRALELAGLHGWRDWASRLAREPLAAIDTALNGLDLRAQDRAAYFYRLLGSMFGWSSFLRRITWEAGSSEAGPLGHLLAVLICVDAGIAKLAVGGAPRIVDEVSEAEDESALAVLQEAVEDAYARNLAASFNPPSVPTSDRPAVQAVFCIDVRSEPYRRNFEAQSPWIETRGFAGFFGVSLGWKTEAGQSARCPVLLKPGVTFKPLAAVRGSLPPGSLARAQSAPASAFSLVEALGLGYAAKLVGDAIAGSAPDDGEASAGFSLDVDSGSGLPVAQRIDAAAAILKNMSLRERFARIILLCGHTSSSANNSHAAGLQCGACGGHGGALNARAAAAILNDPAVRAALPGRGFNVPADTHFLPAVHDTTTDEVALLDTQNVPLTHAGDLKRLGDWLSKAGALTRQERAGSLGISTKQSESRLQRLFGKRAGDWSQVRPEWGLARNAAFIAARRSRTAGVDLGGRTFLHEYDTDLDADGSVLTLVLTAPMVVASWINLQYFASTVDNDVFGAGNKTLHNRVGSIGVVLGNGGDLRTGLAMQSVHSAEGVWYHEPLRLQVVVEAPADKIDAVLAAHQSVRDLVQNGWVRLFSLDPNSDAVSRRLPDGGWELVASSDDNVVSLSNAGYQALETV